MLAITAAFAVHLFPVHDVDTGLQHVPGDGGAGAAAGAALLHNNDEGQGVVFAVDKAGEGGGIGVGANLGGAGLGADLQPRQIHGPVHMLHVVAHELPQGPGRVGGQHFRGLRPLRGIGLPTAAFRPGDQIGLRGPAAPGNGPHIDHILAGIDEIRILPDPGPGQVVVLRLAEIKAAPDRGDAVQLEILREPDALRLLRQRLPACTQTDLREHAVAGVRQSLGQALLPMGLGTGDAFAVDDPLSLAGKALLRQPRVLLQGGGQGGQLEDGARRIGGVEKAIDIDA